MAAPLLQSVFTPTDFDRFLDEVGLADLSPQARVKLVDDMTYAAQYAIMTRIQQELGPEQKIELIRLMQEAKETGDYTKPNNYVSDQFPNLEVMVDEEIERIKDQMRPSRVSMQKIMDEFFAAAEQRLKIEEEMKPLEVLNKSTEQQAQDKQPGHNDTGTAPVTTLPPEQDGEVPFPWESDTELRKKEEDTQAYQDLVKQLDQVDAHSATNSADSSKSTTDSSEAINDELHAIE